MSDRDTTKWTLWWTSGDQQMSMFGGNFDSREAAEAGIAAAEAEFRGQLCDPSDWDEDSTWDIEEPSTSEE